MRKGLYQKENVQENKPLAFSRSDSAARLSVARERHQGHPLVRGSQNAELSDVYESLNEIFSEKGVDELILECSVVQVVRDCRFSGFRLKTSGLERPLQLP